MSSSRANASAVQRRTNNPSPAKQPVTNTRYQQQQQPPVQNPKLSVSDAIALTTIRLAKVETFINNLPPLDQLYAYSNQQDQSNCMVTENVFNSIVSRLDKLEKVEKVEKIEKIEKIDFQPLLESFREESKLEISSFREESKLELQIFREEIQSLREENRELKNLILFLQNYTLKTNQKLTDLVFQQDNIQVEEEELSQHIHELLNSEKDETISVPITDIPEDNTDNTDNLNINI